MRNSFILVCLLLVSANIFSEEHLTGKMLIMGWGFTEEDTPLQNNIAIDAITNYAEAAKYQMMWDENDNYVCQIALYVNIFTYNNDFEAVYIYINSKSKDNVLDRYIEFDFFINQNDVLLAYKLVLNFNNYKWSEDVNEKGTWRLVMEKEPAYDFFVSWVNSLRK
jgi:hypothetical protein